MIILFNFYGYKMVISYMQARSEAILEKQVDETKYDESDLIVFKIRLNLPYYTSSPQYERVHGSIIINGRHYVYVKRRIHNDMLEVLCLPNEAKTRFQLISNELAKSVADDASAPKKNITIKISLPVFFQTLKAFYANFFTGQRQEFREEVYLVSAGYFPTHKKPPRVGESIQIATRLFNT